VTTESQLAMTEPRTFKCQCGAELVVNFKETEGWDDQEFTAIADAKWELRGRVYYCPDCSEDER
jgi:hypothetical protein